MTTHLIQQPSDARMEFFSEGLTVPPAKSASADAHYRAGRAAWHVGKIAEAGRNFRTAAALAPTNVTFLCALADWSLNTGDLDAALAHSDVALSLGPGSIEARVSRASALA